MKIRIALFLMLYLMGCSSLEKSFEQGDYERSFKLSIRNLEKGKSVSQSEEIAKQSLEALLTQGRQEIDQLKGSDAVENWESAMTINRALTDKINLAQPYLGEKYLDEHSILQQEAIVLSNDIFEVYVNSGQAKLEEAINDNIKQKAQQAYYDFTRAQNYKDGEAFLDSLIQDCYKYGTVIYNFKANPRFEISYGWEIDRTFDDLVDYGNRFQKVYYKGIGIKPDCEIDITFHSLDIDVSESSESETFEERVIDGYNTVTDTSGQTTEEPIYIEVSGEVNIITKTKTVTWEADINVYAKNRNCNFNDGDFRESIQAEIQEYQLSGDQRAIPNEYKDIRAEEFPDEDDLVEELIELLFDEIAQYYF